MEILLPFEILGTAAFAVSGAIVGVQKKMDIFGVSILGLTAAVGGGILRDLILGVTPPAAFTSPVFAAVSVAVSILIFLPSVRKAFEHKKKLYDAAILIMDSIGLGLFTVIGIQAAYAAAAGRNYFLITFVGVLTGVGGGIMRDVFAGNTPYIFIKHFYACASILGAWACALLWDVTGEQAAMLIGALIIIILRLLAAHYHWSLPKADFAGEERNHNERI